MLRTQYRDAGQILAVYWRRYGGFGGLFGSPYFHISAVITALCYQLWWDTQGWADLTFSILPNLLGFSIGAFSILLVLGSDTLELLRDKDESRSNYLRVVASFVHFIVIQASSIIIGLIGKAWSYPLLNGVGFLLLVYSIMLSVAAAMRLFRLARVYNAMKATQKPNPKDGPQQ